MPGDGPKLAQDDATRIELAPLAGGAMRLRLVSGEGGLNLISLKLLRQLAECAERFPQARVFVLAGNERYFSVGADLRAIAALDAPTAWNLAREGQYWLGRIAQSRIPYVAAIDGFCLGGGLDLALACRRRICSPRAYLGHHGARLGLVTGWGGTQRLARLLGAPRALEHLLAAEGWTPNAALQEGLVSAIAEAPESEAARLVSSPGAAM